jgi:4-carboxymuconolactone decarboxylase
MAPSDRTTRGTALLEKMLGSQEADETRRTWANVSPDFEKYVVEFLAGEIWSRGGLELRDRSLVTIAALAALGRPKALELNLKMALNNGATKKDIVETLLQIAPYAGFPACWEALATAREVFGEQGG